MPAAPIENILTALGVLIAADATITTAVGTRIFHAIGTQNAALPLIVYQLVEAPMLQYFGDKIRLDCMIDVDIFASADVGSVAATGVGAIEDRLHVVLHQAEVTLVSGFERLVFLVQTRGVRIIVEDSLRSTTRVRAIAHTT